MTHQLKNIPEELTEIDSCQRLAHVYTKSHFMDYVSRATFASSKYPGPLHHIQICSESHIIDVLSTEIPVIKQTRSQLRVQ